MAKTNAIPAHPAADVWPMLPPDELGALADSIAEVGLLEPIVHWADPETGELFLLDGRNRAAACKLATIEPETVIYEGDPVAYVLARNDQRRHMTKGQRAMAAWLTAATRSLTINETARSAGMSDGLVAWAKVVAEHAPALTSLVVSGGRSLKDAYDEARERRDSASSEQKQLADLPADLAVQVREETLTLYGARAEAQARETKAKEEQRDARSLLDRIVDLTLPSRTGPLDDDFIEAWATRLSSVAPITDDDPDIKTTIDLTIQTLTQLKGYIR